MSTCSGTKGVCGSALGVQGQADTGHKAQLRPPPPDPGNLSFLQRVSLMPSPKFKTEFGSRRAQSCHENRN